MMAFAPEYVDFVLRENFEDAKTLFLDQLMAMHDAHLVMLADRGILAAADARRLRAALDAIPRDQVRRAVFDGTDEDLFCHVNRLLVEACGEDVAGRLHTARSRNDIDMALYRMRQRELVLGLLDATLRPARHAGRRRRSEPRHDRSRRTRTRSRRSPRPSRTTCWPSSSSSSGTRSACARPTSRPTAARWAPAPSPAPASTSTASSPPTCSDSSGPTGNTYGSIATVDYLLQNVSAAAVALTGFGRFVQDVLQWCTMEFGYLRLSDGFVQPSSIMPQKRNPVSVEHARSLASRALGEALGVMVAVHNTPFGDIVDTEDDLQPLVFLGAARRDARHRPAGGGPPRRRVRPGEARGPRVARAASP